MDLWVYRAELIRVIDGDTYWMMIDNGMYIHSTQSIRLKDIDTPEIYRGTEAEKEAGQAARDFAIDWFSALGKGEWPFRVQTDKDTRSFNRYVADVGTFDGRDLGTELVAAGHGIRV